MKTEIRNGRIIHTFKKGTDTAIVVKGLDWGQYDEVRCDFKPVNILDATPMLSLSTSDKIRIEADSLVIPISAADSKKLQVNKIYFDIKQRTGDVVHPTVIPGEIIPTETVTNL